jgi:hypothetical protein
VFVHQTLRRADCDGNLSGMGQPLDADCNVLALPTYSSV